MNTKAILASLLLIGLPLIAPGATAAPQCGSDSVIGDTYCLVERVATPITHRCDTIGLVNYISCIVGKEISAIGWFAESQCARLDLC